MEKIKDLYHQYLDQIIAWYNGLEQLYQYGVIFLLFVVALFIIVFLIISRSTKQHLEIVFLSGHEKTAVFSGTKGIEGESERSVENVGIDIDDFL